MTSWKQKIKTDEKISNYFYCGSSVSIYRFSFPMFDYDDYDDYDVTRRNDNLRLCKSAPHHFKFCDFIMVTSIFIDESSNKQTF